MNHTLVTSPAVADAFGLERTPFGKLVLTNAQGQRFEAVVPVRAFPIQAPEEGISVLDTDGHEVAWVRNLADGCVEVQAEGPVHLLTELRLWCERGPSGAEVHSVSHAYLAPSREDWFEIRA